MKVIYIAGRQAFIREGSRQIDRNTNTLYINFGCRVAIGAVYSTEMQQLDYIGTNLFVSKVSDPTLWAELKDLSRDDTLIWFYSTLSSLQPKLVRWNELKTLLEQAKSAPDFNGDIDSVIRSWSTSDQDIWTDILAKRANSYSAVLFFIDSMLSLPTLFSGLELAEITGG